MFSFALLLFVCLFQFFKLHSLLYALCTKFAAHHIHVYKFVAYMNLVHIRLHFMPPMPKLLYHCSWLLMLSFCVMMINSLHCHCHSQCSTLDDDGSAHYDSNSIGKHNQSLDSPPSKSLASLGAHAACTSINTQFEAITIHDSHTTGISLSLWPHKYTRHAYKLDAKFMTSVWLYVSKGTGTTKVL